MGYYIRRFLINLLKLVEWVEFKYYYGMNPVDIYSNDMNNKIQYSLPLDNISVLTDTGFQPATHLHITKPFRVWKIITNGGLELECADNHILFDSDFNEVFIKDLHIGSQIQTRWGIDSISHIRESGDMLSMVDLTVDSADHRFYTGDILSHNTVSSGIMMLHFILFNNNKNCLVTANKLDTAIEVLDKIRNIYEMLPFFLKKGIKNWNQKFIVLENKSRIKGFATTKTASIGQTGDFLYLDEFAYLPDNIAEKFYKSVFPTISNIDNSKIIITSTPNGFNLFHKLLTEAEKPEGEKSSYVAKRVYWWQVPKRFVTYIRMYPDRLKRFGFTETEIFEDIKNVFTQGNPNLYWNEELKKWVIDIFNSESLTENHILNYEYGGIKVSQFSDVTTWKKETIKDIGGEEAFNQEYDLRFINSSRSLIDEALTKELDDKKTTFQWLEIPVLSDRLKFSYDDLLWTADRDVFDPAKVASYKIFMSIDISEGLGLDYSVINIFKLGIKDERYIENNYKNWRTAADFCNLEQIGIYRSNLVSVEELAEIFYLLGFEFFSEDNLKVTIEMNSYGGEFLAHLPNVFGGYNEFGNHVFLRFKHRVDALEEKIGLKQTESKNLIVKDYQDAMMNKSLLPRQDVTISELHQFIKQTTNAGNVKYAADGSGNDDITMTLVNQSQIFQKVLFKSMCEDYINDRGSSRVKELLRLCDSFTRVENHEGNNYTSILDIRRKVLMNRRYPN